MSNYEYNEEWAERMHKALEGAEGHLEEFRGFNRLIGAMMSAANDIRNEADLRTIVRTVSWRMVCELQKIDNARADISYGLQLPEAEQAEDESL